MITPNVRNSLAEEITITKFQPSLAIKIAD